VLLYIRNLIGAVGRLRWVVSDGNDRNSVFRREVVTREQAQDLTAGQRINFREDDGSLAMGEIEFVSRSSVKIRWLDGESAHVHFSDLEGTDELAYVAEEFISRLELRPASSLTAGVPAPRRSGKGDGRQHSLHSGPAGRFDLPLPVDGRSGL
jgi:hypothetical protein